MKKVLPKLFLAIFLTVFLCGSASALTLLDGKLDIKNSIRQSDVAVRYGGDEIAVVLPETAHAGATMVAEKLRKCIHDRPIATPHALITMTASVGIGFLDERCEGLDALIDRADQALYEAKRAGRDCVRVWKAPR